MKRRSFIASLLSLIPLAGCRSIDVPDAPIQEPEELVCLFEIRGTSPAPDVFHYRYFVAGKEVDVFEYWSLYQEEFCARGTICCEVDSITVKSRTLC